MQLFVIILPIVLVLSEVESQTWDTGVNLTVSGCSSHCSLSDDDLSCWNSTLNFFSKVLIGQLRHYIAVQVDIDQWYRRHGKPSGQDMDVLALEIEKTFLKELQPHDILLNSTLVRFAEVVSERVRHVSDRIISWVPHFQCPTPCEYRHNTYRNLLIASMVLNVCLMLAVIPFMVRMIRHGNHLRSRPRLIAS